MKWMFIIFNNVWLVLVVDNKIIPYWIAIWFILRRIKNYFSLGQDTMFSKKEILISKENKILNLTQKRLGKMSDFPYFNIALIHSTFYCKILTKSQINSFLKEWTKLNMKTEWF